MTLHIRDVVAGPVVLGPSSKHLTTITGTGEVVAAGIGVDGIDGPAGSRWPIANDGTVVSAGGFGISLASGGIVTNDSGALISGGIAGILIDGAAGTVTNAGGITGIGGATTINTTLISGDGIALLAGGSVTIDNAEAFGTNVGDPSHYAGPVLANFVAGDVIDLKDFGLQDLGISGVRFAPLTPAGVLQVSNGPSHTADLAFTTSAVCGEHFQAQPDGGTGILITLQA